jgi:hypothetical protein
MMAQNYESEISGKTPVHNITIETGGERKQIPTEKKKSTDWEYSVVIAPSKVAGAGLRCRNISLI